jgi:polyisoprenoid-binding protein YceI
MKKIAFFTLVTLVLTISGQAQKYVTKNGFIRFYSDAAIEKIEATNRQVNAAMDIVTGDFVFRVLMKSFTFEKALMQEHFNENYVESDKFPNATFLGKIINIKEVNFQKDGIYPVTVEGKLTLHGETKQVSEKGTFEVKEGKLIGKAKFNITLSDYKISIPNTSVNNISKTLEIIVEVVLDKLNQE